jgi:hypothetical protein
MHSNQNASLAPLVDIILLRLIHVLFLQHTFAEIIQESPAPDIFPRGLPLPPRQVCLGEELEHVE